MKSYECTLAVAKPEHDYPHLVSISGLLCRSTVWEGKFRRHKAASKVPLMALRYGRRVFACAAHSDCTGLKHHSVDAQRGSIWQKIAFESTLTICETSERKEPL